MEELFKQREDEEVGDEKEQEDQEKEKKAVPGKELMVTETEEEEQVKLDSRLGAEQAQEVQMEDKFENNNEAVTDKQKDKERMCLEERDEKKKSRKRRGKKQSERVKNKRGLKDASEQFEETQEVSVMSSEESSALLEPPVGLMNSCDLSDPVYMGCGGSGLYCPPVPVPLLYSSQPPVSIQPVPPQPHGTKRPHSPLLPPGLTHQAPQPLEVSMEGHFLYIYILYTEKNPHCTCIYFHYVLT